MSRHSKWAKIKHQKAATDAKRGQLFSTLVRAIGVAARDGGGDLDRNAPLRLVVDRALAANMPKENITRAIERATGIGTESAATALTLEGYGPGGAALLIDVATDNRNRTVAEIRRILATAGGSLGESGSVSWQFERRGLLTFENTADPDRVELTAIDAGAFDTMREGNSLDVITPPEKLKVIEEQLRRLGLAPTTSQLTTVPKQPSALAPAVMEKLERLVKDLVEHPDVVDVTTNALPPEGG